MSQLLVNNPGRLVAVFSAEWCPHHIESALVAWMDRVPGTVTFVRFDVGTASGYRVMRAAGVDIPAVLVYRQGNLQVCAPDAVMAGGDMAVADVDAFFQRGGLARLFS